MNDRTTMTLWHSLECPYSMRVRLMLHEKAVPYDSQVVPLDDVGEEVRRRNPKGSVPVLEDGGCSIYEARIIAEYLEDRFPERPLFPRDPVQRARARMIIDWVDAELEGPIKQLEEAHTKGGMVGEPVHEAELQDALERVHAGLHTIGDLLHTGDFVLGEYGIVDVFLAPFMVGAQLIGLRRDEMPASTAEWIDRLRDRATVASEARRRLQAMGLHEADAA